MTTAITRIIRKRKHTIWRCNVCGRTHGAEDDAQRCEGDPLAALSLREGEQIAYINRSTDEKRVGIVVSTTRFCWPGHYWGGRWMPHRRAYVVRTPGIDYEHVVDVEDVISA